MQFYTIYQSYCINSGIHILIKEYMSKFKSNSFHVGSDEKRDKIFKKKEKLSKQGRAASQRELK